MAENYIRLTIDINSEITHIIKAKQGDAKSRFLDVTLVDNGGVPVDLRDHRVRFNATKPDGCFVFNDAEITDAANGRFLIELTDQVLAVAGKPVAADISVFTRDEKCILTTREFEIHVQRTNRNDAALESINEYSAILTLMQRIIDLYGYVKQDITKLQTFNFDNLAALEEVKRRTVFSGDGRVITETITDANVGVKIAERVTEFNADETITQVIEVYGRDGETVIKRSKITTDFSGGETIEETGYGYNDYSVLAAYLMYDAMTADADEVLYKNDWFAGMTNVKQGLDAALAALAGLGWNSEVNG